MKVAAMTERRDADRPRVVELSSAPEVWVDGFGNLENLGGGVYRIPLYKIHRAPEGDGPALHEIVCFVLANIGTVEHSLAEMRDTLVMGLLERLANPVH
jgi:hypothetical protein